VSAAAPLYAPAGELEARLLFPSVADRLTHDLIADRHGTSRRHLLLEGPHGAGKTHVVQVVAGRLERVGMRVVRLPPGLNRISRLDELLEAVLEGLGLVPERSSDPEARTDLALARLRELEPPVVVVENLHHLLERQLDRAHQARLRALLLRAPPIVLLGTATRPSATWMSARAPFYDFFQRRQLPQLSRRLMEHVAGEALGPERQLLVGRPRRVLLWARQEGDLVTRISRLLDALTPGFQAAVRALPPQTARVLAELACPPVLVTPAQAARACGLPTNQVTAQVRKLQDRGLVRPGPRKDGRSRYVEVVDPALRAWMGWRERWPDLPRRLAQAWGGDPYGAFLLSPDGPPLAAPYRAPLG
jgi:DNA-binding MarR family transcriptional regulator